MSIKIIRQRERHTQVHYFLHYQNRLHKGSGFSFECDEDGNYIPNKGSQSNFDACKSGKYDVEYTGINETTNSWIEPAVGLCHCGAKVELPDPLDNECERCGEWYNSGGQCVTPSHQCDEQGEPYDYD